MVLDTNIVIALLQEEPAVTKVLDKLENEPKLLPAVAYIETLAFSRWRKSELEETRVFLQKYFTFIPLTQSIAEEAANVRRQVRIKLPDAAIAATALAHDTPLVTRNVKDFIHIPNLQIITI